MAEVNLANVLTLFNGAMTLVNQYKAARQQWKEANPNDAGQLPDERPLFDLLVRDSVHLVDHAKAVQAKYAASGVQTQPIPLPEPSPAPPAMDPKPGGQLVMRVSAWVGDAMVLPEKAELRLDDGTAPIAFEPEDGRLKFTLPSSASYGWHGLLTADGQDFHVTLAPDVDVRLRRPVIVGRRGVVGLVGRTMADLGGPFLGLGASLFWAPWGMRNDPDRTEANMAFLADAGADYLRQLLVVGPGGRWEDRTSNPQAPGWDESVAAAIDTAAKRRLRTQPTIFGGVENVPTKTQRQDVVRRFADIVRGRESQILYVEVANEGWQNGFADQDGINELAELADLLRTLTPNLVVRTCPGPDGYRADGPHLTPWHLDRSVNGTGGIWRPTRQGWEAGLEGQPWVNQEGIGIGSSVNADPDVLRGICYGLNTWICGGAAHTVHHGAGIRGGGQADLERGRPANAWEQPTLQAIIRGLSDFRKVLPADLPNFTPLNSNDKFPAYPFDTKILMDAIEADVLLRAFCARAGQRFILLPIDVKAPVEFKARGGMQLDIYNLLDGQPAHQTALANGGSLLVVNECLIVGQFD